MKLSASVLLFFLAANLSTAYGQADGWYVELGSGPAFSGDLAQEGFNLDSFCYPGFICCPDLDGCNTNNPNQQSGYRWNYQIPTDPGFAFRAGAGREQGSLRIDLNIQYSARNLQQIFSRIAHLDESPAPQFDPNSGVQVTSVATIGRLRVASFRINTFLDLLPRDRTFRPYLGMGTGVARAVVTDLYYEERYSCTNQPCSGDLSSYDSLQDEHLADVVLLASGHAGFEYILTENILAGVRFSYTLLQDFNSQGEYTTHRVENLTNTTTFSKLNLFAMMATVRYRL